MCCRDDPPLYPASDYEQQAAAVNIVEHSEHVREVKSPMVVKNNVHTAGLIAVEFLLCGLLGAYCVKKGTGITVQLRSITRQTGQI